jgi:hypothetical protein
MLGRGPDHQAGIKAAFPALFAAPARPAAKGARAKPASGREDVANSTHAGGAGGLCWLQTERIRCADDDTHSMRE